MSLDSAMHSFAATLAGIPGFFVTSNGRAIVVHVDETAEEDDVNRLKQLAIRGWENFRVKVVEQY